MITRRCGSPWMVPFNRWHRCFNGFPVGFLSDHPGWHRAMRRACSRWGSRSLAVTLEGDGYGLNMFKQRGNPNGLIMVIIVKNGLIIWFNHHHVVTGFNNG